MGELSPTRIFAPTAAHSEKLGKPITAKAVTITIADCMSRPVSYFQQQENIDIACASILLIVLRLRKQKLSSVLVICFSRKKSSSEGRMSKPLSS